jgi:hypothetical protein
MDQTGRIIVTHPEGGQITATWECRGGKGRGAEVRENTTPMSDEDADLLVNTADLAQGIGTYEADLDKDAFGWFVLVNVDWCED